MTKQSYRPESQAGGLTHSPFAKLLDRGELAAKVASTPVAPARRPAPPRRIGLRLETAGRSGKVVTRITGLPAENLEPIASRLREALGCGAVVEEPDLLLLGSLVERASQWLDGAGDLRAIAPERVATREPPVAATRSASGKRRGEVRPGQRVAIVQKADQESGRLTEGIVRDLLTQSATHPHGIKVRLESGEVGRVKIVYG